MADFIREGARRGELSLLDLLGKRLASLPDPERPAEARKQHGHDAERDQRAETQREPGSVVHIRHRCTLGPESSRSAGYVLLGLVASVAVHARTRSARPGSRGVGRLRAMPRLRTAALREAPGRRRCCTSLRTAP